MPAHSNAKIPLVIIIAGSGPTDRNCNGQGFKSDAYKKMATQFALNGIATYRYDKRGIGKSVVENFKEEDVNFEVMIDDAKAIIAHFQEDTRFSKIAIAGHSEGSLVGMMAVRENQKYISIAGSGFPISEILKEQLKDKLGPMKNVVYAKIDSLQQGKNVANDLMGLESLFRPSVQPFLKSWMALNPTKEIKKLKCPILFVYVTQSYMSNNLELSYNSEKSKINESYSIWWTLLYPVFLAIALPNINILQIAKCVLKNPVKVDIIGLSLPGLNQGVHLKFQSYNNSFFLS
jgi:pimeloyl-ACP methyl ester carboxylesterase